MLGKNEVEHNSQNIYYRSPLGAAEAGTRLRLGIKLRTKQEIHSVLLRFWHDRTGEKLVPLSIREPAGKEKADKDEAFYCVDMELPEKGCLLWYYFIISASGGTCYYGNNAEQWGGTGEVYEHVPPSFQITVYNKGAKTPDWFKHSIMYQIFPDRFCRVGNAIISKKGAVYHADWTDDPCYYKDPDTKEIVAYDFFGGNLQGIRSKLPYLKELGISVIYMNPVFESESNHHYDTGDYHKIDPILGTAEDFRELVAAAREQGIRIILDGVFSHTGSNSRYFNRAGAYDTVGAFQSKESPYYEWYNFRNFPYEYDSWWNFSTLPNVTETTPSYMDFIIHKEDSVLHHWMKQGIAGWRLDVIDELPEPFSQAFYAELKKTDPEAVMIGEVWEDASHKVAYGVPREYLCGQEMDSAMNYPFRDLLFNFLLGRGDGHAITRRFESLRENYPRENFYAMMNLISSHDVQRAITVLGEAAYYDGMPAVEQSRSRLSKEQYNLGVARLMMASLWQMTYPGVPCIYYGDEIGMQGFKDPYNRRPYPWEGGDAYLRDWYKKIIALRKEHPALQTGELLPLWGEGDAIAYARVIRGGEDVFGHAAEDEAFVAVFNRSRTESLTLRLDVSDFAAGCLVDALGTEAAYPVVRGHVSVRVEPLKGMLLQLRPEPQKHPREAGILLHPTSLPSKYGIGGLGREAYEFLDFLKEAGQHVWQILPLGPTDSISYSPYQSSSAFAGNPLLIDLDDLIARKLLTAAEARCPYASSSSFVDFERVQGFQTKCLKKAWTRFRRDADKNQAFQAFCQREAGWLDDFALFLAAKREFKGRAWTQWPEPVRRRDSQALSDLAARLSDAIGQIKFEQFLFDAQWQDLHAYAQKQGIRILGDMPIFLAGDSADVWAHQELFDLNPDGTARTVAGVPPDYFSATGQLWGNPQYDWTAMKAEHYAWWKKRFHKLFALVDMVRIDHFRGFESYWEVDGKAETAINGRWVKGPGKAFFDELRDEWGRDLPIIAEDLGIITEAVEDLRDACGFPGMQVLHFALHFNEQGRLGCVTPENSVVYTGTHDNNTTAGWYAQELDDPMRCALAELLHADADRPKEIAAKLIAFAYASHARLAITPMQDVLQLDERSRMNTPGTVGLNWKWRLKPDYLLTADAAALKTLCQKYKR